MVATSRQNEGPWVNITLLPEGKKICEDKATDSGSLQSVGEGYIHVEQGWNDLVAGSILVIVSAVGNRKIPKSCRCECLGPAQKLLFLVIL